MALAVNRTGVILKKRDMSYHRPASVERCATATYQSTCPGNTIERCLRARRFACRLAGRQVRGCFERGGRGTGRSRRPADHGATTSRRGSGGRWSCQVLRTGRGLASLLIGVTTESDCDQLD